MTTIKIKPVKPPIFRKGAIGKSPQGKFIVLEDKVVNEFEETVSVKLLSKKRIIRFFQILYYRIKILCEKTDNQFQ